MEKAEAVPVKAKLTNGLQDVNLSGFSQLLTADTAGYETAGPADACAEPMTGNKSWEEV